MPEKNSQINPLDTYFDAGTRAGQASKQRDAARAKFHSKWAKRAIAMEPAHFQAEARKAFDDAYRAAATPQVAHFR